MIFHPDLFCFVFLLQGHEYGLSEAGGCQPGQAEHPAPDASELRLMHHGSFGYYMHCVPPPAVSIQATVLSWCWLNDTPPQIFASQTYLTLSLGDIAEQVGLPSTKEAELYVLRSVMIFHRWNLGHDQFSNRLES